MTAEANALGAALGFSSADLEANRRGKLSPAQIRRIEQRRKRNAVVAALVFFALALVATGFFYLAQLNRSLILFGAGAMLTIVNAVMVWRAGRSFMRVGGDLRAGEAEALAGEVERVLRRGRAADNYVLRIDGVDLFVSKAVFNGFQHLAPYRIYRSANSRVLLSAEAAS